MSTIRYDVMTVDGPIKATVMELAEMYGIRPETIARKVRNGNVIGRGRPRQRVEALTVDGPVVSTYKALADKYGLHYTTVYRLVAKKEVIGYKAKPDLPDVSIAVKETVDGEDSEHVKAHKALVADVRYAVKLDRILHKLSPSVLGAQMHRSRAWVNRVGRGCSTRASSVETARVQRALHWRQRLAPLADAYTTCALACKHNVARATVSRYRSNIERGLPVPSPKRAMRQQYSDVDAYLIRCIELKRRFVSMQALAKKYDLSVFQIRNFETCHAPHLTDEERWQLLRDILKSRRNRFERMTLSVKRLAEQTGLSRQHLEERKRYLAARYKSETTRGQRHETRHHDNPVAAFLRGQRGRHETADRRMVEACRD